MELKDYYQILELPPSASRLEIKKAYRRLALLHHPDKNGNTASSEFMFSEIKTAYEILSNPATKATYLQHRWYKQSTGSKKTQTILTPESVLKQAIELERYIATVDSNRMDKQGLYNYITEIIAPEVIEKLNAYNDLQINDSIIQTFILCAPLLSIESLEPLQKILLSLQSSTSVKKEIKFKIKNIQQQMRREKKMLWLVLLVVLLLCFIIYISGK